MNLRGNSIVVAVGFAVACTGSSRPRTSDGADVRKLQASADRGAGAGVSVGETALQAELSLSVSVALVPETEATITLRNGGACPIFVNRRLAVGNEILPGLNEVWLEITDDQGEVYTFTHCRVRHDFAKSGEYGILRSGMAVQSSRPLSRCFRLVPGRTYTLIAHYRDANPKAPAAPRGAARFAGELTSEPVTFTID